MSGKNPKLDRRKFLKLMGLGTAGTGLAACDLPSTVTLEEGKEEVVSYLSPEEYVIPGIGVWYASTCLQCSAACGIHGRVREGRALKIEGNPNSQINRGKTCQMGQASVQAHYNPDRLMQPMLRKGGNLTEVKWDEALKVLQEKIQEAGDKLALMTGAVSGHQAVLSKALLDANQSAKHFVYETVAAPIWQKVCKDTLDDSNPVLDIAHAKSIFSIGADFLGTWISPVHFATQYGAFRNGDRGVLIQAESKMSLTGANADKWLALKPGSEANLALGIANQLLKLGANTNLPPAVKQAVDAHDASTTAKLTGVDEAQIKLIASTLKERSPSLVLAGGQVEGQEKGYEATAAVMVLNVVLGNVGKTIKPRSDFPFPQLVARSGGTKDMLAFAEQANAGGISTGLFYNVNPVYTAPASVKMAEAIKKVGFKVAFTMFVDESSKDMDLLLPIHSPLEDWGTHVPAYQGEESQISIQQPLMEPIGNSRGYGDLLLAMLKAKGIAEYAPFKDYYAYLRSTITALPASYKGSISDEQFWNNSLQSGVIKIARTNISPIPNFTSLDFSSVSTKLDAKKITLIPSPRLGLWDGRHANLPWLQEAPDQITKVVWDSWVEIHPNLAKSKNIKHGDIVSVSTGDGSIKAKAYLFKGIHPEAVAIPMGQGHESYGRYATGIGTNPMNIIQKKQDKLTGELALYASEVKVESTGDSGLVVRAGAVDTQRGRKLVGVISADQYRRTEGG